MDPVRGFVATLAVAGLVACAHHPRPCSLVALRSDFVTVRARGPVSVHVDRDTIEIAGQRHHTRRLTTFRPIFPFAKGVTYKVRGQACDLSFVLPQPEGPEAAVVSVKPDAPTLPENTLRLYLTFTVPMAEGAGLNGLRLHDLTSDVDGSGAFFDPRHELWSADRRRLTVLFDPGRVKTGLRAHDSLGRALQAGHRYRLDILAHWPTMDGRDLSADFSHEFEVGPPERQALDPRDLAVSRPAEGSREPLFVDFGRPVDPVSVGRFVQFLDPAGAVVAGRWMLLDGGRTAKFEPDRVWRSDPSAGHLQVDVRFEDVAGNTYAAAFDHVVGSVRKVSGRAFRIALKDAAWLEPEAVRPIREHDL